MIQLGVLTLDFRSSCQGSLAQQIVVCCQRPLRWLEIKPQLISLTLSLDSPTRTAVF